MAVENPEKEKEQTMVSNPAYSSWLARDQKVLSYLLNSLSKEILMHVLRMEHTADVWKAVEEMFASQSISKSYDQRKEMQASTNNGGFETSANAAARMRNRGGGYRPRNNNGRDDNRRYDDRPMMIVVTSDNMRGVQMKGAKMTGNMMIPLQSRGLSWWMCAHWWWSWPWTWSPPHHSLG
ncbi:hypothetical protein QYE76_034241 [Lolium multiflorum]|uniref:Retrotransposon Copia-like N-terminal domain-containing protein n=1 Tax=Lolium multiflorum TaxID=4521 RepID=A0AAD8QWZ5_LOLMU|nr:hypothetical protein QYE76_034241 [Lolium multiflorum]